VLRRRRRWEDVVEDDPGAGLLNLFDVWIAFAVALLLAMISYYGKTSTENAALQAQLEALRSKGVTIEHYRPTQEKMTGEGMRLGTAYRLSNGEVVYIPDSPAAAVSR
jgi:hypothetical protein